jgi:hypothetical protein
MTTPVRARLAAATLIVLTVALGACSGDDDDPAESTPTPSATTPPVKTVVTVGDVTGKLPRPARARLTKQVGAVVGGWMDAAYLSGDYPRRDFAGSWPGFTPGAQVEARHDRKLMSNADVGSRVDGVEAKRKAIRLDVLAVKQRPVGVTAHVALRFKTTGDVARGVRVSGRLYLTHTEHGWRVFGYDVSKGVAR